MSARGPRPPALSRRLLVWAASRLGTPELADDAAELFAKRCRRQGVRAARRWYRRQALATLRPLISRAWGGSYGSYGGAAARDGPPRSGTPLRGRLGSPLSLLDFKLGLRMLVRYPGLTLVAGLAMAFAIAVGAGTFEFLTDTMYPSLPLDDGDRVVRLHVADSRIAGPTGVAPADFATWSEELGSVRDLGAFHGVARTLRLADRVVPVDGIAVSASAFAVARAVPILGRPLVAGDEAPGAPPVVVLGHDLWRSRFAGGAPGADGSAVVGRVVRLGDTQTTVVGVMPEEFSFPVPADVYVPLRLADLVERGGGGGDVPGLTGFGRLAPDATPEAAGAELRRLGAGAAELEPGASEHLTPVVEPFAYPVLSGAGIATNTVFAIMAFLLVMIMGVVCANVALLLFARAAAREEEIAVRAALGAGRARIVAQLFVEALVLAGVALAAGLWAASAGLERAMTVIDANSGEALPFWVGDTLSPATVGWAALLAVFGASIAGVIPALQVTGRDLHANLQRGAGRGSGARLGRLWTAIVVSQVALTVALLPAVFMVGEEVRRARAEEPAVAEEEFLVAQLEAEGDPGRFRAAQRELRSRLAAEPRVRGVTVADRPWPGWYWSRPLEVEGVASPSDESIDRTSKHMAVGPDFFDVMGARLVAGRLPTAEDGGANPPVVVVDEPFVDRVLGGRNAVGRQIRIGGLDGSGEPAAGDGAAEPWHEIVGVVADLGLNPYMGERYRGVIYHPLSTERATGLTLAVRVSGDPETFATRLRVLALGIEPPLRLESPQPLDHRRDQPVREYGAWFRVWAAAGAIALLLTLAGIYAVMAFTVSRRTREIGVRVALGGRPPQVAVAILSRALRQVGYGVLAGGLVISLLVLAISRMVESPPFPPPLQSAALLTAYMGAMTAVCLLACVVPMRRALRVEPTEALGAEA